MAENQNPLNPNLTNPNTASNTNPFLQSLITLSSPSNALVFLNLLIATKLSISNYLTWRSQIEPLLHGYQFHQYLTSSSPDPTITDVAGQIQLNLAYLP
jgi:hypothetical protein